MADHHSNHRSEPREEHEHKVLHPKRQTNPEELDRDDLSEAEPEVTEAKTAAEVPPPTRTPSMNTPRVHQTTLTTDLEPERSHLGTYLTIIAIALLAIFGVYQLFSKSGLRRQVTELQRENTSLKEQIAQLQSQPVVPQAVTVPQPAQLSEPAVPTTIGAYYPVLYRNSIRQQIGQLITSPTDAQLAAITLHGNGGLGDNAELAIFETNDPTEISETDRPDTSKLFNASQVPTGQPFAVQLDKPFELKQGKQYFIVIRPSSSNAQTSIGYGAAEAGSGEMWVYSRKVSSAGEVLDPNPSWQMIPNVSLTAELRLAE